MHVPAHQATLVRRFAALSTTAPHDPLISMPTSVRIKGLVDNSACEPGKPDRLRTPRDRRLTPSRSPRPCPGGLTTFNRGAPTHPLLTSSQCALPEGVIVDVESRRAGGSRLTRLDALLVRSASASRVCPRRIVSPLG
jgi:hypothetical protein